MQLQAVVGATSQLEEEVCVPRANGSSPGNPMYSVLSFIMRVRKSQARNVVAIVVIVLLLMICPWLSSIIFLSVRFQLRSALDKTEELEVSNGHLVKRLEKMKANRSALLSQQ